MCKVFAIIALCFVVVPTTSPKPSTDMRILNGNEAAIGQFPFIVSVTRFSVHRCGGSILSNRYVLSAAHCVSCMDSTGKFTLEDVKEYSISAGSNNRLYGAIIAKVAEFVVHENYFNELHDLSILRLETPLVYSDTIKAIPLDTTEVPVGTTVTIAGWGRQSTNGLLAKNLQYTTEKVLSRSECYDKINLDSPDIYCLARPVNNGTCIGDSGGPAILADKLVAVANFVFRNRCGLDYPDGFAKISTHLDWIRAHSDICIE
ncbi:serine protease SP24D-like [Eurosta solidaginis]|uniref:serine protease SP24D-like n=1 Tax=Eurosta solidaginis TaxID=178769 RepID=UPI003530BF64